MDLCGQRQEAGVDAAEEEDDAEAQASDGVVVSCDVVRSDPGSGDTAV